MSTSPFKEQDQFICDWFDNLDEDFIRQLQELHDDYDMTPRRAYHNVFGESADRVCTCKACLLPGQKDPGASLATTTPESGFLVPFPSSNKCIDREAYRMAVLDLAALLCEEHELFEELALRLRNVATDGIAEHRGEFYDLLERSRANFLSVYGRYQLGEIVHKSSGVEA